MDNRALKKHTDFRDLTSRLGGSAMDLCHYCGACIAVCPHDALSTDVSEKPRLDAAKCTPCSLCYNFCSGIAVDYAGIKAKFFSNPAPSSAALSVITTGTDGVPGRLPDTTITGSQLAVVDDRIMGPHRSCFLGHAVDNGTRRNGSSGGMVTAMLEYALRTGLIDGAIVAGAKEDQPWLPDTKLVRTPEELHRYSQSKYVYIPTNAFLRDLWDKLDGREGRYAIVALPCQVHAIREMQRKNVKYARNIKYIFGLICGYNMSIDATEFVRSKLGIRHQEIERVRYRDLEWPGGMTFYLKDGTKRGIDIFHYHYLNAVFLPTRCRTSCSDFFVEHSDIAFGDSWLKELYSPGQENLGWSSLIARTGEGHDLLMKALSDGAISLREVAKEKIEESFPFNIKYKKRGFYVRLKMARHKPNYVGNYAPPDDMKIKEIVYHVIYNLMLIAGGSRLSKAIMKMTPLPVLRAIVQALKWFMGYPPNARDAILKHRDKSVF